MNYFEILDRIKPRLPVATPVTTVGAAAPQPVRQPVEIPRQEARSLVVDGPQSTFVTVPVETAGLNFEDYRTRITGRLVGAEKANSNGQFWTSGDLAFGVGSVAFGPLNWLHEEKRIIGTLTSADLITPPQTAAAGEAHPYIRAESVVWSYLFPGETYVIREAAARNKLYYSMECISRQVECVGPNGCGAVMAYQDAHAKNDNACDHIRQQASARRFIKPVFQGSAVIVPPVTPGWADSNAELMRAAASREGQQISRFTDDEVITAQILKFVAGANGR